MRDPESDEEFDLLLRVLAAAETRRYAPVACEDRAALRRFRRRLRTHRAAERRVRAARLAASLCGASVRAISPVGGLRAAVVVGAVVLAGAGAGVVLWLTNSQGAPGTTAQEHPGSGSGKSTSARPSAGRQDAGGRRTVIETSMSGLILMDGPDFQHSASAHPAAPPAEPAPGATIPAGGTWIVKGKAIARTREIQLKAKAGEVNLTATVSARNTSAPCQWSASTGTFHSVKKPPTTDPTPVTFSIKKPTKVVTLGVRHTPSGPDAVAGECVMTDITVEGNPVPSRHASPSPTPVSTERGGPDEPDNQRRAEATPGPTRSRPPGESLTPSPSP